MSHQEEQQRIFAPPLFPITVFDQGYGGELNKQAVDADYYTREIQRFGRESTMADKQSQSEMAFAGAIAMSSTLEYTDPEELVHITKPRIAAAAKTVHEALTVFEAEGREQCKEALELRVYESLLAPLILYKPMCMYGDSSYARNRRQSLLATGQNKLLTLGAEMLEIVPEKDSIKTGRNGVLHMLSTVALLNSQNHPDMMVLPALVADDRIRRTDILYVQLRNGAPTTQYVQVKMTKHSSRQKLPPHQALITNRHVGNRSQDSRETTWRTLDILVERQFGPSVNEDKVDHIDERRREVASIIATDSVSFDLLP